MNSWDKLAGFIVEHKVDGLWCLLASLEYEMDVFDWLDWLDWLKAVRN